MIQTTNLLQLTTNSCLSRPNIKSMSGDFWRTPRYSPRPIALLIMYIHDLTDNVQSLVRLLADADALLYSIVASDADRNLLQCGLRWLESRLYHWQVEFNPSKCKIVTISHKNNPPQRKYVVCGVKLEQGGSFPYLGVTDQYQAQVVSPCFHDRS